MVEPRTIRLPRWRGLVAKALSAVHVGPESPRRHVPSESGTMRGDALSSSSESIDVGEGRNPYLDKTTHGIEPGQASGTYSLNICQNHKLRQGEARGDAKSRRRPANHGAAFRRMLRMPSWRTPYRACRKHPPSPVHWECSWPIVTAAARTSGQSRLLSRSLSGTGR